RLLARSGPIPPARLLSCLPLCLGFAKLRRKLRRELAFQFLGLVGKHRLDCCPLIVRASIAVERAEPRCNLDSLAEIASRLVQHRRLFFTDRAEASIALLTRFPEIAEAAKALSNLLAVGLPCPRGWNKNFVSSMSLSPIVMLSIATNIPNGNAEKS